MMQRERSDVYIIPPNFAKEGTLFSGRIEGRNAFEAAVLFIVLFRILFFIDVSIKLRIYIGIIVILPLTILAVVGVNGESLLSFIIQFIRFVTRRRVVTVPDGQYRLKRNRRIRRQQKKQQKQERKKKKRQQEGGVKDRKRSRRIEAKAERSSVCIPAMALRILWRSAAGKIWMKLMAGKPIPLRSDPVIILPDFM